MLPSVGLIPTHPLQPAGTRPEPAVSVPSAKVTMQRPTAAPDPEEDPPVMKRWSKGLTGTPNGVLVPTSPDANWSMLVFPMMIAPGGGWESR